MIHSARLCGRLVVGVVIAAAAARSASAQLRVVDYNIAALTNPSALTTVLQAFNRESIGGVVKPIDVLILQETDSSAGEAQQIVNILNGFGTGTYARSTVDGATTGAGRPTLVYRTETIQPLISQVSVVGTSGSGAARSPMRYQLRPVGYDFDDNDPDSTADDNDLYIYNSHYKSSMGDEARRNVEALAIRANSDALGQGAHVIYAGDFNIYESGEPMWTTLTVVPGNGRAVDPINPLNTYADWHDGAAFKPIHTQNPAGNGFVGGGMDDRFDFQLVTDEMMDSEGMAIIPGSYHAFGNNGTHSMNGAINTGSGLSEQNWDATYGMGYTASVRNALTTGSDHLPVVAQYQLPAKMASSVAALPSQVIVGAPLSAQVTVYNSAGGLVSGDNPLVIHASGADELDYTVNASGAAGGATGGSDQALGGLNTHPFALDTAAAGAKSASFQATATSPQVVGGVPAPHNVNYSVLDHANASFSAATDENSLTIDFGSLAEGSGTQDTGFSISNLMATVGFTAALDSVTFIGSGDTGLLTTDLAPIDNLAAGGSIGFLASFDTSSAGEYSATYTLNFSDDTALVGAFGGQQLVLNLLGEVTTGGIAGDFDDDGDADGDDIDILWHIVRGSGSDPNSNDSADLDGNTLVNEDDVDNMLASKLTAGPDRLYGDSDLDGDVDANDFDDWRLRDGYTDPGTGSWAIGDFDGDGDVDGTDLELWRLRGANFPIEVGPHSGELAAVPEPSALVLAALGLVGGLLTGRRGRDRQP